MLILIKFQTTSLCKSDYQILTWCRFSSSLYTTHPFFLSFPFAGLHNRTPKSIWQRRLMRWQWQCTYKELSWPSEGWNHPRSPKILKTWGALGKDRQREGEREEGERISAFQCRVYWISFSGWKCRRKEKCEISEGCIGPSPITK